MANSIFPLSDIHLFHDCSKIKILIHCNFQQGHIEVDTYLTTTTYSLITQKVKSHRTSKYFQTNS